MDGTECSEEALVKACGGIKLHGSGGNGQGGAFTVYFAGRAERT